MSKRFSTQRKEIARLLSYWTGGGEERDGGHSSSDKQKALIESLQQICQQVEDAENSSDENLEEMIQEANEIILTTVDGCYGINDGPFYFIESFSHSTSRPLVKNVNSDDLNISS